MSERRLRARHRRNIPRPEPRAHRNNIARYRAASGFDASNAPPFGQDAGDTGVFLDRRAKRFGGLDQRRANIGW